MPPPHASVTHPTDSTAFVTNESYPWCAPGIEVMVTASKQVGKVTSLQGTEVRLKGKDGATLIKDITELTPTIPQKHDKVRMHNDEQKVPSFLCPALSLPRQSSSRMICSPSPRLCITWLISFSPFPPPPFQGKRGTLMQVDDNDAVVKITDGEDVDFECVQMQDLAKLADW